MSEMEFTLGVERPLLSQPYPMSHPARLATLARLFGLQPTPVDKCRVLELDCALGSNLIPMAQALPNSSFVGIDESAAAIAAGNEVINALGLGNIVLKQQSYANPLADQEPFDYVIAHGVFSRQSAPRQDHLLALIFRSLQPKGLAYVSYNIYPGWHMRGMVAEMLQYGIERCIDPGERVGQARSFLDLLVKAALPKDSTYQRFLREEQELLRQAPDLVFEYEYLQPVNNPVYFHGFCDRARAQGLRYVSDANAWTMAPKTFDPEVQKTLDHLALDRVQMEQYMDFLQNRLFRHSILCRDSQVPNYRLEAPIVLEFAIASPSKPRSAVVNLAADHAETFSDRTGASLTTTMPIVKAALMIVGECWPQAIPFRALLGAAIVRLGAKSDLQTLEQAGTALALFALECYTSSNLVELHLYAPAFVAEPSAKPLATPLARLQAERGAQVTTQRHEQVVLSEAERQTVRLLDGTRDRAALVEALLDLVEKGILAPQKAGQQVSQAEEKRHVVEDTLNKILTQLGRSALLVA